MFKELQVFKELQGTAKVTQVMELSAVGKRRRIACRNSDRKCGFFPIHPEENNLVIVNVIGHIVAAKQYRVKRFSGGEQTISPHWNEMTRSVINGGTQPRRVLPQVTRAIDISASENVLPIHSAY